MIIIVLQFISNLLIPDHDAGVFLYPTNPNIIYNNLDNLIQFLLSGLIRWDGQYFFHITQYGYTYENSLAFFPLLPLSIRICSIPLQYALYLILHEDTIYLITAVILNIIFFVLASLALYWLTLLIFPNPKVGYLTSILFCLNPASIFFSAVYTESLFAWLSFTSMYLSVEFYIAPNFKKCVLVALAIGLSGATRSNGLLNIGFILYFSFSNIIQKKRIIKIFFLTIISIGISIIPFVLIQIYDYQIFCNNIPKTELPKFIIDYGARNNFVMPGQYLIFNQSWCNQRLPLAYSYVQNHYWNVGFLKYYQFKQIPNFLLALPIIYCILHCGIDFISSKIEKPIKFFSIFFTLFTSKLFVFVVHSLFLIIFCLIFVHIQVTTRMLCSASPVLYWYCASRWLQYNRNLKSTNIPQSECDNQIIYYFNEFLLNNNISCYQKSIRLYFLSYFLIGTILFSNFLPWT